VPQPHPTGNMAPMDEAGQLRLTLTPAPGQGQIAGVLFDEAGDRLPFSSWLALLSLLEAARGRAAGRVATSRQAIPNLARPHQGAC
jgi:hypothetical protein